METNAAIVLLTAFLAGLLLYGFCFRKPYLMLLPIPVIISFTRAAKSQLPSVEVSGQNLNFPGMLGIACFIILAFYLAAFQKLPIANRKLGVNYRLIGFFSGACLVSLCFSSNLITSMGGFVRWGSGFLLFLAGAVLVDSRKKFINFLKVFCVIFSIIAVLGLIQLITHQNPLTASDITRTTMVVLVGKKLKIISEAYSRISGIFDHPSIFGGFLVCSLPFLFSLSVTKISRGWRLFSAINLVTGVILLFATYTRIAWFAFLVSTFIMAARSGKKKWLAGLLLAVVAGILLAYPPFYNSVRNRLQSDTSYYGRFQIFRAEMTMFLGNPIVGNGPDMFAYKSKHLIGQNVVSHGDYPKLLAEVGLLGFLAYTGFYFILIRKILRSAKGSGGEDYLFRMAALSSVCAFLIFALSDNAIDNNTFSLLFLGSSSFLFSESTVLTNARRQFKFRHPALSRSPVPL